MKTQIVNYIQNILGISALKIRIETDDTLIASLRKQVLELQLIVEDIDVPHLVVQSDIENFITERNLNDAIEEEMNNQDWDSIVADALSERRCSNMLDEIISEQDFSGSRSFNEAVVGAVQEQIEGEDGSGDDEKPLLGAIRAGLNNANNFQLLEFAFSTGGRSY